MTPINTANTVSILSGGTTYYLHDGSGEHVSYNGANTPWTSPATSCIKLVLNQTAGPIYVPQPAHAQMIYSGGPPFSSVRQPLYESFDSITEPVGIQLYATNKDNAIYLLRLLRTILNTALYSAPAALGVKSGTNTGYTDIYICDIDESALYLSEPDGTWRATATWTRAAFFGLLSTGETLTNAVTFANVGTGSPDNVDAYNTGAGDLIYRGSPLNIDITSTTASASIYSLYLASIYSRTYDASGAGSGSTSSTISGALVGTGSTNVDLSAALSRQALKLRVLGRFSTIAVNAKVYAEVFLTGSARIFTSAQIQGNAQSALLDFGAVDLSVYRDLPSVTALGIDATVRVLSTNGSSASATLSYLEYLLYYTFCTIENNSGLTAQGTTLLRVGSFGAESNRPCLPLPRAVAHGIATSGGKPRIGVSPIRGTPPHYYSGASLYAGWNRIASSGAVGPNDHRTTDQAQITVTHAPLYLTARGGS